MKTQAIPSWVPDWEDDTAYPADTYDWTLGQWVWAFLRRNPDYRKDYAHFSGLPSYYPEGGKTSKWSGRTACLDDDTALRYCDPPALPGETVGQHFERLGDGVITEMALEGHLMEKWGVLNLPDPADDDGYRIMGSCIEMPPYVLQEMGAEPDGIEHVTLQFDLRFNIIKQVEDAESILNDELEWKESIMPLERVPASNPRKKLPELLRAFDADFGDETYHLEPDSPEQVTLRFDLRFDISKQVARAMAIIKKRLGQAESMMDQEGGPEWRVQATGPQIRKLPEYLRAFDADLAGATPTIIAAVLYPRKVDPDSSKQAAYRAAEMGKHLVYEKGYKNLLKFY